MVGSAGLLIHPVVLLKAHVARIWTVAIPDPLFDNLRCVCLDWEGLLNSLELSHLFVNGVDFVISIVMDGILREVELRRRGHYSHGLLN